MTKSRYKSEITVLKTENAILKEQADELISQVKRLISIAESLKERLEISEANYDKMVHAYKKFFPEITASGLLEWAFHEDPADAYYIEKIEKALKRAEIEKDNLSLGRPVATAKRKQAAAKNKKQIEDAITPLFLSGGKGWELNNEKITDFIDYRVNSRFEKPYKRKTLFQIVKLHAAQHRKNPPSTKSGL